MFVYIDEDEWYPVFSMLPEGADNFGVRVEISEEEYARYKTVMTDFQGFQERMIALKEEVNP